jgi:NDP-sugar pyrophosphorylase family protein
MTLPALDIPVAILAGGLATRLRPITEKIPKSLISVAGKPFLAHQLELLHARGIRRAVLCVGHLGEMIQRDFGSEACGIKLEYSFDSSRRSNLPRRSEAETGAKADGPKLLGTGGAIKRALPLLGKEFFVLYGDSYLPVDYRAVAEFFRRSGKPGCMTVYRNEGKYDTSNVVFGDGEIIVYDKKAKSPEMRHIDYGLSLFQSSVFEAYAADRVFDLAEVMGKLVREKQLAGYEVRERFYEIGSPAGLAELENLLKTERARGYE